MYMNVVEQLPGLRCWLMVIEMLLRLLSMISAVRERDKLREMGGESFCT